MNQIQESDEISPETMDELEKVDDDIKEKAKSIAGFIKNLEAESKAINEAILSMEKRASSIDKKIENLRVYLKDNLEKCNIQKINSPWFDIMIRTNPHSVVIQNDALIPNDYFSTKEVRSINKIALKSAIMGGMSIPGALLTQNTRLEIR
jgi:predicted nuclease with TOPRIM domain